MSVFSEVGGLKPRRSFFDLSYEKKFTADIGDIIPIMAEEMVPGDKFNIGSRHVIRWNPLVAPLLHNVSVKKWSFFVPYRLLTPLDVTTGNSQWETFITGGQDGPQSPDIFPVMPNLDNPTLWLRNGSGGSASHAGTDSQGLMDYFGFPLLPAPPPGLHISAFPLLAYKLIMAEYFMDEDLDETYINNIKTSIKNGTIWSSPTTSQHLPFALTRTNSIRWHKDYFTSARPFQQRGISPALPVAGQASVNFNIPSGSDLGDVLASDASTNARVFLANYLAADSLGGAATARGLTLAANATPPANSGLETASNADTNGILSSNNTVDFSLLSGGDMNQLRTAIQLQKWMERNARAGVRYTEFLREHFGTFPRDDRLQRPEYIGGNVSPVIFSEVLQTSQSTTDDPSLSQSGSPQGNLAGHGISVDNGFIGSYTAHEYGVLITLMTVVPRSTYSQGINRQWLRQTRFDYYFPEFAHLSEQGIYNMELFAQNSPTNASIFGFTGRYNEMRYKESMTCGQFRGNVPGGLNQDGDPASLDYWHLGREFSALPALNDQFIAMRNGRFGAGAELPMSRVLAVPSEPPLLVNCGNIIKAFRPLPRLAEPGFMDHF